MTPLVMPKRHSLKFFVEVNLPPLQPLATSPRQSADSPHSENLSKSTSSNDNKSSWKKDKPKDSTKLGKNGRLTTEEREHCIKEGLCLYCGEKGHTAQDCLKSKAAKACAAAFASMESKSDSADSKK